MKQLLLSFFFVSLYAIVYGQQDFFAFRKRNKTLKLYTKDSYIAFQTKDKEWFAGNITKVQNDSFFIKPTVVVYNFMSIDTIRYNELSFALTDVYAVPKKGIQIDYIDGKFQITRSGGHMHWYWVKNGWLFRVGGVSYASLDVTNGIIKRNYSLSGGNLAFAAVIYLIGEIMHQTYGVTHRIGKKYHFQSINISK